MIAVAAGLACGAGTASAAIDRGAGKASGVLREKSDILRAAGDDVRPRVAKGSQRLRVAKKRSRRHAVKQGRPRDEEVFLQDRGDRFPGPSDPAGNGSVSGGGTGAAY
ncbi:MAG: hypothetical protein KDJ25_15590 [Rhodoblastus sp.]|nr:hypothetical protein [Rhodoblastus sp.]